MVCPLSKGQTRVCNSNQHNSNQQHLTPVACCLSLDVLWHCRLVTTSSMSCQHCGGNSGSMSMTQWKHQQTHWPRCARQKAAGRDAKGNRLHEVHYITYRDTEGNNIYSKFGKIQQIYMLSKKFTLPSAAPAAVAAVA